jgi:hypothetical protein
VWSATSNTCAVLSIWLIIRAQTSLCGFIVFFSIRTENADHPCHVVVRVRWATKALVVLIHRGLLRAEFALVIYAVIDLFVGTLEAGFLIRLPIIRMNTGNALLSSIKGQVFWTDTF